MRGGVLLERWNQRRARREYGRQQAECNAGGSGHRHCQEERGRIDGECVRVPNTFDFSAVIAGQQHVAPGREQQPDHAPTNGEQYAFEQELPDDAAATRAQCQAHRDLLVPGRIACQQQTRQIGARNHEQADDGCGEQLGKPRGTWPSLRMNALHRRERESRTVAALRVGRFQLSRKAAHLGTSLFQRPTRFQPSDQIQARAVAAQHVEAGRSDMSHHVRHEDIDRPPGLRTLET